MRFNVLLCVSLTAIFASFSSVAARPILDERSLGEEASYDVLSRRDRLSDARAAHRATTNLPGRHQEFHVPGGPTYSGKDVRHAVFNSHLEHHDNQGKSNRQLKKSPLKPFGNSDHREPHHDRPHDVKSINHMHGSGHEYPIGDPVHKGPARVITQHTSAGHTKFMGVVAHDMSRASGSHGYNDHFQVRPTGSRH